MDDLVARVLDGVADGVRALGARLTPLSEVGVNGDSGNGANWFDVWGFWIGLGALAVSFFGFRAVRHQLQLANRANEVAAKAARSNLYANLSNAMQEISRTFVERPHLRAYFYEDAEANPDVVSSDDRIRIQVLCEQILDFADDLVEQHRTLPDDLDWSGWWAYLRSLYVGSPALRAAVWNNLTNYYPDYVLQAFGLVVVRGALGGGECFVWVATGDESPERYPWVGPWTFARWSADGKRRGESLTAEVTVEQRRFVGGAAMAHGWLRRGLATRFALRAWPRSPVCVATVTETFEPAAASFHDDGDVPFEDDRRAIRTWLAHQMVGTNVEWIQFSSASSKACMTAPNSRPARPPRDAVVRVRRWTGGTFFGLPVPDELRR